jgi:hypothetical protein
VVVLNEACTVIESALTETNIELPISTYNLNVKVQDENPSLEEQYAGEGSI